MHDIVFPKVFEEAWGTGSLDSRTDLERTRIFLVRFANMSGDPEQEYFADGVTEDIITAVSRLRWVPVVARNSSFAYKGRAVDVRRVGRELGVRYVLFVERGSLLGLLTKKDCWYVLNGAEV